MDGQLTRSQVGRNQLSQARRESRGEDLPLEEEAVARKMAGSDTVLLLGILVDDIRHITRDGEGRRSCSHGKVDGSAHLE